MKCTQKKNTSEQKLHFIIFDLIILFHFCFYLFLVFFINQRLAFYAEYFEDLNEILMESYLKRSTKTK